MENEVINVNGYVQNEQGKWVLSAEAKAEALALYYSGRLAYNEHDLRHDIGRYNSVGEVIPYSTYHNSSSKVD